jgi:hypothetical protein
MKIKQELIDEVMDNFDFAKVQRAMRLLNWTWHDVGIPKEYDLKVTVRDLIKSLESENCNEIATGGFIVRYNNNCLRVIFSLEEWIAYES